MNTSTLKTKILRFKGIRHLPKEIQVASLCAQVAESQDFLRPSGNMALYQLGEIIHTLRSRVPLLPSPPFQSQGNRRGIFNTETNKQINKTLKTLSILAF